MRYASRPVVNQAAGIPGDWPVPAAKRAEIRTQVAGDFFRAEHGRDAVDARELAATIAKHSRPRTNAVAGFDMTFSPVKSVSVLWAVADRATAAVIERAHQAAVADALKFLERHALFTRLGSNGVRQVDLNGLVAAAFTHRDSRAGDPDLHTHVVADASERVTATVEASRATWQFWHVYAEAQRQVRAAIGPTSVPTGHFDAVVAQLVDVVLEHRSLRLSKAGAAEPGPTELAEPVELLRADGAGAGFEAAATTHQYRDRVKRRPVGHLRAQPEQLCR